jgi:hypothetical protein
MLWSSSPTANSAPPAGAVAGQQLQPLVLQVVGILELVDQDVRKRCW